MANSAVDTALAAEIQAYRSTPALHVPRVAIAAAEDGSGNMVQVAVDGSAAFSITLLEAFPAAQAVAMLPASADGFVEAAAVELVVPRRLRSPDAHPGAYAQWLLHAVVVEGERRGLWEELLPPPAEGGVGVGVGVGVGHEAAHEKEDGAGPAAGAALTTSGFSTASACEWGGMDASDDGEWGAASSGEWLQSLTASQQTDPGDDGLWEAELQPDPRLEQDVEWFRCVCAGNAQGVHGDTTGVAVQPMPVLDQFVVDVSLDVLALLGRSTAEAWGMASGVRAVVLRIPFSKYYTRSRESPRAEVFQNVTVVGDDGNTTTEKRCVGMMKQIEKYALYSAAVCTSLMDQRRSILNQALRDYWAADALQTADPPSRRALRHIDPSAALHADDHATLAQRYGVSDGSVAVLAEMLQCVDTRWMVRALVHSKGDVEAAANMLLAEDRELVIPQLPDSPSSGSGEEADGGRKNSVLERMTSWLKASPSPSSQLRKSLEEEDSTSSLDAFLKSRPEIGRMGLLVVLYSYLAHRIPLLHQFCVICDQRHVIHQNMIKPSVCSRDLCCFAFQMLGVAADGHTDMAVSEAVVDLQLVMLKVAAQSPRKETILDPFPQVFDARDRNKLILDPECRDFAKLNSIVTSMPPSEGMFGGSGGWRVRLDECHEYAMPLLTWVINSNRCHIVKLQQSEKIECMNTPHQFLLLSAAPEKELSFQELKARHGTFFAFHGSPIENWHSIMRTGLRNASGTKLQMHGVAHGKGIYLSTSSNLSFGYSRPANRSSAYDSRSQETSRFIRNHASVVCIALCEVINTRSQYNVNGNIIVVPQEDRVVTRFFFVYDTSTRSTVDSSQSAFVESVRVAMDAYQTNHEK